MLRGMRRRRGRSYLTTRTQRAVAGRRVFPYLALVTLGLGLLGGFLVTLVDKRDFPTFGDGVWWAIVTLGTVGYGDIVPHTAWGRVVGSVVIVLGVTFLSVLTAVITSHFVSSDQTGRMEEAEVARRADEEDTRLLVREVLDRLDELERRLPPG